jgi:4-diphosphocytidyl-2-C-methyl-D-erythritol kinase
MKPLTAQSYTRVTLALDIIGKITEGAYKGYHELGIIKHRINLSDTISVEESAVTEIICDNPMVPLDNRNICWQALNTLKKKYSLDRNARITIKKNIPVMGGLAGGSANCATMLLLLTELFDLNCNQQQFIEIGRELGMDVPYYFVGNTAFDTEATGRLEPISTALTFDMLLAVPDFGVPTKSAYASLDYSLLGKKRNKTSAMREALLRNNRDAVIANMHNDFEFSVFRQFPKLKEIKRTLSACGCRNAILTGSGSTMLCIADAKMDIQEIKVKTGCKILTASTKIAI